MAHRAAHGKARQLGRLTQSECVPVDELPAAIGNEAGFDVDPATRRGSNGQFLPGNRLRAAVKVVTRDFQALRRLEKKGDSAARGALAYGKRYSAHRRRELAELHGGELSAGIGAMVETAGQLLASSRYWNARSVAEGSADFARLSAQLAAGARQAERDAWELASREAAARPRMQSRGLAALLTTGGELENAKPAGPPPVAKPAPTSPFAPRGGVEVGSPLTHTSAPLVHDQSDYPANTQPGSQGVNPLHGWIPSYPVPPDSGHPENPSTPPPQGTPMGPVGRGRCAVCGVEGLLYGWQSAPDAGGVVRFTHYCRAHAGVAT